MLLKVLLVLFPINVKEDRIMIFVIDEQKIESRLFHISDRRINCDFSQLQTSIENIGSN